MDLANLFNHNNTMFFESDDQNRVGLRGRYLSEFNEQDYAIKITGVSVSGFKGKDLNELVVIFPSIQRLTIEKTSNLKSLNGIEKFAALNDLVIEECSKLTDLGALANVKNLTKLNLEKFILEVPVLQYLVGLKKISDLYLRSTISDLSILSDFGSLNHLTLIGGGSVLEELPELPKITTSFVLDGFSSLKSAAFMVNLDPTIRIRWWGPNKIGGLPAHLREHDAFKAIELVD
jgi:hypothetical protein